MSLDQASKAFWTFHQRLHALVERQQQTGKVRALPLSAVQLAREAEQFPEFNELAIDLFKLSESPEDLARTQTETWEEEGEEWDSLLESVEPIWEGFLNESLPILAQLLRRSGYYHALLSGADDFARYYTAISDRMPAKDRTITTLYLLDGCEFARDRFDIAGVAVVRMAPEELERLGPAARICEDFFPDESIDSKRLSKHWFVKTEEDRWTAYDYEHWDDPFAQMEAQENLLKTAQRNFSKVLHGKPTAGPASPSEVASGVTADKVAAPNLTDFQRALLLLSLYDREFFEITKIFVCDPGWTRILYRSAPPRPKPAYRVADLNWPTFESFLALGNRALQNAENSKGVRPLLTALHRYLQATFATGDVFPQWETKSVPIERFGSHERWMIEPRRVDRTDVLEDAVLHYVFALEALLTGDVREAITEKISTVAELIVGRDDTETGDIRAFLKRAYGSRSDLVHGRELKDRVDVARLRCICQRVLAVALGLYAEDAGLDLSDFMGKLPVSREQQGRVERVRGHILSLLSDESSLSEH